MKRRHLMLSSSAAALSLSLAVAALPLGAAPASAAVGPGWTPSPPLWETAQVQATQDTAPPEPAPAAVTADPPGELGEPVSERITEGGGPLVSPEIPPDRLAPLRALGPDIPQQQLRNLPRPYTPPAVPPTEEGQPRASVVADELSYDETEEVITATGGVEMVYEGRVLRADTVRYDTVADRVTAEGNVSLVETDGTVYFFDYTELTGDMKSGFAREATLLLADRSRASGELMTRENEVSTMRLAIYTACDPCEDPDAAPLWRLRARRVTHDEADKTVYYRDVWLEAAGLPVFYTPYLSHPDPTVKRKSGFLPPSYGTSKDLGTEVTVPYYLVIDDSQDLLSAVRWTDLQGPVLEAQYRGLYTSGKMEVQGSITQDNNVDPDTNVDGNDRIRNHLRANLEWYFDPTWRGGIDVNLASDDTYMRKYDYGTDAWLVNEAYVEGFRRRTYARARGFYFQELRVGTDPGRVPRVLPELTYSHSSAPTDAGVYWTFDASGLSLTRSEGTDTTRVAAEGSWNYIHYGSLGDVTELSAALRADAYIVDTAEEAAFRTVDSGTVARVIPTVGASWRFPFTRDNGWFREVLEPVASVYISPRGQNKEEIPNEDSRDFEFDATNLFSRNRFTGWDRVENGPRANYGMRWAGYWPDGSSASVLFGQSWHMYDDGFFGPESGLDDEFSDYVGRATVNISSYFDASTRFRLDREEFEPKLTEITASGGLPVLRLSANYLQAVGETTVDDQFGDREEITVGAHSRFSRYWTLFAGTRWNLDDEEEPINWYAGALYDDECFSLQATMTRDYTADRDYEGGFSALFRVVFKTLGEVNIGSN
ncbi:Outer membrane protein Imp [Caenispirillum salinarum AK4]|uniref:LPS-assembly protein LptD n=1 Tax=Caenispirillum salinarum AK4 TaxID=1238182 RepID=K9HIK9_9PROT|nr:LPS assembly protein LptD [Caenispirillum salinarum]EKV30178.1 Outer membrane protein Imp [Caenispirillum salinarum AK4]